MACGHDGSCIMASKSANMFPDDWNVPISPPLVASGTGSCDAILVGKLWWVPAAGYIVWGRSARGLLPGRLDSLCIRALNITLPRRVLEMLGSVKLLVVSRGNSCESTDQAECISSGSRCAPGEAKQTAMNDAVYVSLRSLMYQL